VVLSRLLLTIAPVTRPRLQLHIAIATVVAIGVLAPSGYLFHAWQLSRLSRALLSLAEDRKKVDRWMEAAAFLDRYLQVCPQDAAARSELATVYAKAAVTPSQKKRAIALHRRALAAGPEQRDADRLRARLADLLLATGRFLEAEQEANKLLQAAPDDPAGNRVLALSMMAQWQSGALAATRVQELHLLAIVDKARRLNPTDALVAETAAGIYREHANLVAIEFPNTTEQERQELANDCLGDLVKNNPADPLAYLARYRYRMRYGLIGAQSDLEQAMHLAPRDPQVLLTAGAGAYRAAKESQSQREDADTIRENFDRARQLFEKLIKENVLAQSPEPHLGLGDALLGLGELEQAIAAWRQGLKRFVQPSVQIRFHAKIAEALLAAGRINEMQTPLDAIDAAIVKVGATVTREERMALVQAQELRRASWHLQQGRAAAAVPLLQNAIARQVGRMANHATAAVGWNLIGRAYAMQAEWGEAAVAFDRAASLEPNSAGPRLAAAYSWLQVRRGELAADRAEQAVVVQPSAEAWFVLAAAEYQVQLSLPASKRSWARFENAVRRSEQAEEKSSFSAPWRLDLLRADFLNLKAREVGEFERGRNEALEVLQQAETEYAADTDFWCQASLIYQRLEAPDEAHRALETVRKLKPRGLEMALAAAHVYVLRKDYDRATQALEAAVPSASAQDQSRLRLELAEVAIAKQDLDLGHRLLAAEAERRPGEVAILRRLAELALDRNDLEAVNKWEKGLAATSSLGQWWARYFRAVRLYRSARGADDSQLVEALAEQVQLAAMRPHSPISYTLQGMIEQRMGKLEQAVVAYERAIQRGERRYSVFEQIITLLDQLNRPLDVERYLSRLEGFMPYSQPLTEIAARGELRQERPEQAIEIARNATQKRPDDALAHLWYGRLLTMTGQFSQAERELSRAVELAPQNVRTWTGLFSCHVRSKNTNRAREVLRELEQQVNLTAVDRNFVLAQGYEMLGEWDSAAKEYEAALQKSPGQAQIHVRAAAVYLQSDPQRAAKSLRKALEIDPKLTLARRMLATILASRGTEAEFREAEQLLSGDPDSDTPVAAEDRRLNALLLAQYGDAAQVQRAVQLLEQMAAEEKLPGDRLVLARLYENLARNSSNSNDAHEKRAIAREHFVATASQPDSQPAELAGLVDFLLRNQNRQEAASWLDKLEAMLAARPKDDPQTLAQLIELHIRHGSANRCAIWLDRLDKADSDPIRPIGLRARWLVACGNPNEVPTLVEPQAQKWMSAASDAAERARVAKSVGDIYLATEQIEHAQVWYHRLMDNDPAQFPWLVMTLARSGKFAEAIEICAAQARSADNPQPAIVLASALSETSVPAAQAQRAEPILAAAVAKYPRNAALLQAVATFRAVREDYRSSIHLYREVLRLEPRNVSALNNLAMILAESPADRPEALEIIDRAIALAGQRPGLLDTKALILIYQGRSSEAVGLLEAATREASNDARYRFHLAAVYRDSGDLKRARIELQAALNEHVERQILTRTDRKLLTDVKTVLLD
jgi:tetratricopeptide (TPR) repeat protein